MVLGADASGADVQGAAMTRRYRVTHRTEYHYGTSVVDGYSVATVSPRTTHTQTVLEHDVVTHPEPDERDVHLDQWGNQIVQVGVHHPHDHSMIESVSVVEVADPVDVIDHTPWEDVALIVASYTGVQTVEIRPFVASSPFIDLDRDGEALRALAQDAFGPGVGVIDGARSLCSSIFHGFEFDPSFSEISTPLGEVLAERRGVCQDFAHLAVGALRSIGLAARYISGYIETEPPPGEERMIGADASHAWCSVWTPQAGWVDFDPTNNHLPVARHVTVAWGRDYADVVPVRGVMIGPSVDQRLTVSVDVALISAG